MSTFNFITTGKYTVTDTGDEYPFDQELRHAALKAFGISGGINELIALRSRMLQEMNRAILAAYLQRRGSPPSPAEIQRLRQLVLGIWDYIAGTKYMADPRNEGQLRDALTASEG